MTPASALVGRDVEIAAVDAALDDLARGRAAALAVIGEPGIGKSRLLREAADRAARRGMAVLAGRAGELERDLTLALLRDALEPLLADGDETLREAAASGERHLLARAVRGLLEVAAAERPLVVLLDDVQWADPASADVLALLLHRAPRAPVLLGLAMRRGRAPVLEDMAASAAREGAARVVEPGPLPLDAVTALLPGVGPATRERLHRESGGNPFYLEELARAPGADTGGPDDGPGMGGVPRAVRAALTREVAALPDAARTVLAGAAVAGDPFEPELAAAAAGVGDGEVLPALDTLVAAELIHPTADPRRFRFRHPLVRRAVYETAGGGWRLGAHARAADALAARGASPAQRAHHVERAARAGDAVAVDLLQAAAREVVATAPVTAAGWYATARRLMPDAASRDARSVHLLMSEGDALVRAGRPAEARDALRTALALSDPGDAALRVGLAEAVAGLEALWLHEAPAARRLVEEERLALGDGEPGLRAALAFALVAERSAYSDHAAAVALAREARADARRAGDTVLEAAAAVAEANHLHCALRRDDPVALREVDATISDAESLVAALEDDLLAHRLQTVLWLGIARLFTGSLPEARRAARRGLDVARRTGQGLVAPSCLALLGFVELELGDLDAAEAMEEEALEAAVVSGNPHLTYWSALAAAWVDLARGRPEAAITRAATGRATAGIVPWSQVGWTSAEAHLAMGDPEAARAALETFGGVNPGLWTLDRAKAADVMVRVLVALGRGDDARAVALQAPAETGGRRDGFLGAILAHADAAALAALGDHRGAARRALEGAAQAEAGFAPIWAGRCRVAAGEALAAAGDRQDALGTLRRAAADLDRHGAWAYRDEAVRALRRLGVRPRPATPAGVPDGDPLGGLTPREREVAALVAEGRTNAQIAARLHLSESTVEKHLTRILAKLGEPTRAGVVRRLTGAPPA